MNMEYESIETDKMYLKIIAANFENDELFYFFGIFARDITGKFIFSHLTHDYQPKI